MSGQLSASPFMKVNHQNSKKNGKSVSFSAIETISKARWYHWLANLISEYAEKDRIEQNL